MLTNTFCHLSGVGLKTERRLWEAGCRSWEDMLAGNGLPVSSRRLPRLRWQVRESQERRAAGDVGYFAENLPSDQHWRLFADFQAQAAYVDIETEGLGPRGNRITTIALYGAGRVRTYVWGRNLEAFVEDVRRYPLLVTYNGSQFDLPFLAQTLGMRFEQAHLDLRFVLREVGVTGGLKQCERHFGIGRGDLDGLNGYAAVLLWRHFERTRDARYLETLLAYNAADVLSLEELAVRAYNLFLRRTPFASVRELSLPDPAPNPHRADPKALRSLPRTLFE